MKYGLLRCCAEAGWTAGVCWMLNADGRRTDGGKLSYLANPARWRSHDPVLFDALTAAVTANRRDVSIAEEFGIIPGASYFAEPVPNDAGARREWFERSLQKLDGTDLLFLDPDNGVAVASARRGRSGSRKYIFWDEVEQAWAQGGSLLLFQHFARQSRDGHTARLCSQVHELCRDARVTAFGTANVLFILASPRSHERRTRKLLGLVNERWGSRIRAVEPGVNGSRLETAD